MEDFELAVAKVLSSLFESCIVLMDRLLPSWITRKLVYKSYGNNCFHMMRFRQKFDSVCHCSAVFNEMTCSSLGN
jgi:hypothetical protein